MNDQDIRLARALAPEDIRPGDYVALLHIMTENEPSSAETDSILGRERAPFKLNVPWNAGMPARVVEVCLPYVLLKTARGKLRAIDIRRYRLARVSTRFGRRAFDELAAERKAEECAGSAKDAPTATGQRQDNQH
jgi:hypothetical protein